MAGSDSSDDAAKRSLRHAAPRSYAVGYAKPPEATRFKPGQSGNPKGRPTGARNRLPALNEERLNSIILTEAYRTIKVREGEKNIAVPMAQAIVRSVAVNAAKGNNRAAQYFTQMVKVVEDRLKQNHDDYVETIIEYKCGWEQEIERCKRLGLPVPEPLPHPDDIRINFNTGKVQLTGPFCKEDVPKWEKLKARKAECDRNIAECWEEFRTEKDPKIRDLIRDEIKHELNIRSILCRALPD